MATAAPPTILNLIEDLTSALSSAQTSLPDYSFLAPSKDGMSLLDVKNELFLSYLQNLVFLILLKLRTTDPRRKSKSGAASDGIDTAGGDNGHESDDAAQAGLDGGDDGEDAIDQQEIVKKLVECRVYLENGVRPLETRLKYQMDKVLRAADDSARSAKAPTNGAGRKSGRRKSVRTRRGEDDMSDVENSDDDTSEGSTGPQTDKIDELSYRPNPAAFLRPSRGGQSSNRPTTKAGSDAEPSSGGVYRPPRITPVAPPLDVSSFDKETRRRERRPRKSAVLDEYIATELSSAPLAEPSIGTTVVEGGRRHRTARERAVEAERREYEESHFVRLPKETRKERAAAARKNRSGGAMDEGIGSIGEAGGKRGGYGGEEWRGLTEGVDRIERLTARKSGGAGGGGSSGRLLERSRKREREVDSGHSAAAGAGAGAFRPGERFEKRRKVVMKQRNKGRSSRNA
ncbi:MAG: hypothetical protein M1815_005057 [Lichina confinis]|nr:MAG: hypothetical protein M1815_005057 [Lichina confinis]